MTGRIGSGQKKMDPWTIQLCIKLFADDVKVYLHITGSYDLSDLQ